LQFSKLRLAGFKSFVENTEVAIHPGLTGLVGPNGCGKSNLVEALRWVMGENSARKMRGTAMDDVIFAGTSSRPSRNLAEVSLVLDNSDRTAPAAFNEQPELEITRRIEREHGSSYSINGSDVRARDVQLLFADMASGAHSTAMVSQGRVGALINAKPTDRRALLEEAAGITGLHSRRHEAELRLKAAESNLERVDDVLNQLDQQLQGLKRQARQANRYRNLSGHIRRAEAVMYHLRFIDTASALAEAEEAVKQIETLVAELTQQAAAAQVAEAEAAETLPPLRQAEAEAAAALHRLSVARDGLDAEERRALQQKAQLEQRLQQIGSDLGREEAQARDAQGAIERLEGEATEIQKLREGEAEAEQAAAAAVAERLAEVNARQQDLDRLTERAAQEQAARSRLNQSLNEVQQRLQRLVMRRNEAEAERDRLMAEGDDIAASEQASQAVTAAEQRAEAAREAMVATEAQRTASRSNEQVAREAAQKLEAAATRLAAEEAGLAKLLANNGNDLWPPMIDALTVQPGWEKALGAAFGEDLSAASDQAAPRFWEALEPLADAPALPEGCRPLTEFVTAPDALARRLSQIGVIEDEEQGASLRLALKQGQRLVSKSGSLWRWDGFTAKAGAPSAASLRLEQRNRLADLRVELNELRARVQTAQTEFAAAREAAQQAEQADRAARDAARQADQDLNRAREAQAQAIKKAAARASRLAALAEAAENAMRDEAEARARLEQDSAALRDLPPEQEVRGLIATLREEMERLRQALAEARTTLDLQRREATQRARRLEAIGIEHRSWTNRAEGSQRQIAQLNERRAESQGDLETVSRIPGEIAEKRTALLDQIAAAEAERSARADALANAENNLAQRVKAAKDSNASLGEAREERVRRQGEHEHIGAMLADLAVRIKEALDCAPGDVLAVAEVPANEPLPDLPSIENKLERLKKERDTMGPVNLRAEIEATEVEQQLTGLQTEKADLIAAIDRLRQGISSLNKEGRERLLDAFKKVDEHFQKLFVQVFGGGKAHLSLTDSEDPLEAGLEIMASPPGKRLQTLSLLSGGEQALTALSLLFAVFMTNPAPICVLDEVDAPLDDSNVERLCNLMDEIVRGSETRFIVVTHHPITMARMDRLLGVTMAERGVSTLVSVDLQGAQELRKIA
jgi:chromosome segregation protein